MKIVTVNVPESYIKEIRELVQEEGLYPSRSELIRCAVREFLIEELQSKNLKATQDYTTEVVSNSASSEIIIPEDNGNIRIVKVLREA